MGEGKEGNGRMRKGPRDAKRGRMEREWRRKWSDGSEIIRREMSARETERKKYVNLHR